MLHWFIVPSWHHAGLYTWAGSLRQNRQERERERETCYVVGSDWEAAGCRPLATLGQSRWTSTCQHEASYRRQEEGAS